MYQTLYSNNFIINFSLSLIFLISITYLSFSKISFRNREISIFGNCQPLVIFFIIIYVNVLIFNLIIFFNFINVFNYLIYIYTLLVLSIFFYIKKKNNFLLFKLERKKLFINITLIIFFLIAILPLSDIDSISIHLRSASYIFLNGLENIDLNKNFEFLSLTNQELILLFSPIFKSDNFGSLLNFFSLLMFYFIFQNKISFFKFLLSCPLIIFLISTQKLQLFFALLFLLLFYLVHEKKIKSKLEIFLFILLLSFYASGKLYYIFFSIVVFFYFIILNKDKSKDILFFSLINLLFFLPIFLIKYKYFNNPVAPFFDHFFNEPRFIFDAYANALRNSQGWLLTYDNYLTYLKPFVPTNLQGLTNNLGLVFLLLLFNFNLQKKLFFIPSLLILFILVTGQILSRYYLEAFLLLAFFYDKKNKLSTYLSNFQLFCIITCTTLFLIISYFNYNVVFNKNQFMKNFSYGFYNNERFEKITKSDNYLLVSQGRTNIFSNDNSHPRSILEVQDIKLGDNSQFINYLKINNINYIISHEHEFFPDCLLHKKIKTVNQLDATRNLFIKKQLDTYIYEIELTKCN